ncbi:MAG: hypothetical protein PHO02_05520 [Candidatus Nanoarchaeia archaeon]|nr:hypothetical protein [Candidatus Nanoarchaeia archaeon]
MTTYFCPLCKQTVSKQIYDKITGIWSAKQKMQEEIKKQLKALKEEKAKIKHELKSKTRNIQLKYKQISAKEILQKTNALNHKIASLKKQTAMIEKRAEDKISKAIHLTEQKEKRNYVNQISLLKKKMSLSIKDEVTKAKTKFEKVFKNKADLRILKLERSRNAAFKQMGTLQKHSFAQQKKIQELENQLAKETTPQIEGLLYEDKLLSALKKEFKEDLFEHTGKGGDIIHTIIHKESVAGIIAYECKRVSHFQTAHIKQTAEAKVKRKADYGVLVTNAPKKGKGQFFIESGILIVHPAAVLYLAQLLRKQLISIADMKLSKAQRDEAVKQTIEYLEGAEFKNGIELIIQETIQLYEELKHEIQNHAKSWKKRYESYKHVYESTSAIKDKTMNLLSGKKQHLISKEEYPELPSP